MKSICILPGTMPGHYRSPILRQSARVPMAVCRTAGLDMIRFSGTGIEAMAARDALAQTSRGGEFVRFQSIWTGTRSVLQPARHRTFWNSSSSLAVNGWLTLLFE
jgi:hypothetical protein